MEEMVEIDVEVIAKTDAAILITDGDMETWIPLSQIFDPEDYEEDNSYTIEIPEWLAIEKGLA
jgi:hypothetical protein